MKAYLRKSLSSNRSNLNIQRSSLLHLSSKQYSVFQNNICLNEEQQVIQDLAFNFAKNELLPHSHDWDEAKYFPKDVFKRAATLGFSSIYTDSEFGGLGLGRLEASVCFEGLATGCIPFSAYLSIHNMCAWMVDQFGSTEQKKEWIPDMVSMERFNSYCLTEPNSGSDAAKMQTVALEKGDDFIINGTKAFVSGGGVSDNYLVMCKTGEKEISCIKVDKECKGLSFGTPEKKMGWNLQPTSMVIMEDCVVPKRNLIGKRGEGFKIAMMGLDGGRINIGSCSLGGAAQSFNLASDYTSHRIQFGKKISEFQHSQFKLAEMATKISCVRILLRNAAMVIDSNSPDKTVLSAMAKYYSTQKSMEVANDALQMHGGYGYLKDSHIELIFRDLRVHMILEGTNEVMKMIIAKNIIKDE